MGGGRPVLPVSRAVVGHDYYIHPEQDYSTRISRCGRVCLPLAPGAFKYAHFFAEVGFDSLSFSLLGGAVFFRDLRYTTKNVSVRVLEGSALVRLWATIYRQALNQSDLPCRLEVQLRGLELVLMNNRYGGREGCRAGRDSDSQCGLAARVPVSPSPPPLLPLSLSAAYEQLELLQRRDVTSPTVSVAAPAEAEEKAGGPSTCLPSSLFSAHRGERERECVLCVCMCAGPGSMLSPRGDKKSEVRRTPGFYRYFPVSEINVTSGHVSVGAEKLPVILCMSFVSGR